MKPLIFLALFLASFNSFSQTFLGQSKEEITRFSFNNYDAQKMSVKKVDKSASYVKVINDYETLYYYLVDDICVEFQVVKPYTCQCLEEDIAAYDINCISIGEKEWVSKDFSKLYQLTMNESDYTVSIVKLETRPEMTISPAGLISKDE